MMTQREAQPAHPSTEANTALAQRQAQVVAAITGTGEIPDGFDALKVDAARRALLGKRARELQYVWPILVSSLGERLVAAFSEFAAARPTQGVRADGYAFARHLRSRGRLPLAAALELAEAEIWWCFDGPIPVRRTSRYATARFPGGRLVRGGQKVHIFGRPQHPGRG